MHIVSHLAATGHQLKKALLFLLKGAPLHPVCHSKTAFSMFSIIILLYYLHSTVQWSKSADVASSSSLSKGAGMIGFSVDNVCVCVCV